MSRYLPSGIAPELFQLGGEKLDGFDDAAETHEVLTHPTVGYVRRRNGSVTTYGVWHLPLEISSAWSSQSSRRTRR